MSRRERALAPVEPGRQRSSSCWVDPVPRSGDANMQEDWDLLRQAESEPGAVTWVRLYRWDRPTVSLGRNQEAAAAVDLEGCGQLSIPIVRRPTGGRAVLHDEEVTYAVVSNDGARFPASVAKTYSTIARALKKGLGRLGLQPELSSVSPLPPAGPSGESQICFASLSGHELTLGGRKIAGSAQRRLRRAFLQHGSIPLAIDYETMARVFRTKPELLRQSLAGLSDAQGRRFEFDEVSAALQKVFAEAFGIPMAN